MNEIRKYIEKIRRVATTLEQAEAAIQKAKFIAASTPTLAVVAFQAVYEDLIAVKNWLTGKGSIHE